MSFLLEINSRIEEYADPGVQGQYTLQQIFDEQIPVALNKALLRGEYYLIKDFINVENTLSVFSFTLLDSLNNRTTTHKSDSIIDIISKINEFNETFSRFRHLKSYVFTTLDSLNNKERNDVNGLDYIDFLFGLSSFKEIALTQKQIPSISFIDIYWINLILCYTDECLHADKEILEKLRVLIKVLDNVLGVPSHLSEVFQLLKEKALLLYFKIEYRFNHKDISFDHENNISQNLVHFKPIYDESVKHYSGWIDRDENKIYNKLNSDLSVSGFHHLKRIYSHKVIDRDSNYKIRKISLLNDKYPDFVSGINKGIFSIGEYDGYNKYTSRTLKNFLFNSTIEAELKFEESRGFRAIKAEVVKVICEDDARFIFLPAIIKKIEKNHKEVDSLVDYYSYKMVFEFAIRMITEFKTNPGFIFEDSAIKTCGLSLDVQQKKVRIIVEKFEKFIKDVYRDYREKFEYRFYYKCSVVQMLYKESIIDYSWQNSSEKGLFLKSAYVLPTNYERQKNKIDVYETVIDSLISSLKDTYDIAFGHQEIKSTFSGFDEKVKNNEFKVVQVVAMFVSIATFVLMNVKVFDNKSGLESFAIIIGLAAVFVLFNTFFYIIIVAHSRSIKEAWNVIAKSSAFLVVASLLLISSFKLLDNEKIKSGEEIRKMKQQISEDSTRIIESHRAINNFIEIHERDSIQIQHLRTRLDELERFYK